MIKIRIRNADHEIDIRFPLSESELFAKLGEIHAVEGRDAAQSAYAVNHEAAHTPSTSYSHNTTTQFGRSPLLKSGGLFLYPKNERMKTR